MKGNLSDFVSKIGLILYPYLFLLAISGLLMLVFTKEELYFAVNQRHAVFTDIFFTYVTQLGASGGCIVISFLIMLFNFRKGFLLATSYLITFAISQGIKHWVQAPRPHLFFSKKIHDIYLVKGVIMLDVNSFPSGHSVSAFSAAVVLTYVGKKSWGPVLLLLAVLVAYSRLYLSEHFFEDVVAGSFLGVLVTSGWLYWIGQKSFLHTNSWNRGIFSKNKN
jgi:membrane-associated phospholipid phosphatase